MANGEKIISQSVFEEAIKDILTELVNSTYLWEEYTPEQISDILEITDEQAMQLTKIINDNLKSNTTLWSSNKTDTEIKNALIESNKYSDELIGGLASISLEVVDTLPTTGESNVIYILKNTSTNINTLNVYSNSSWIEVGNLNLDLTTIYTKTEVDNLLADKADDNTVVHADDVVQDLTTTSGSTTLSTAGLQTELDKKANDDEVVKTADIATTIDSTSTNDTVAGAKAVSDKLSQYVHIDGENMLLRCTSSGTVFTDFIDKNCTSNFRAYHVVWNSLVSGIPCGDGYCTVYTYNDSLHKKAIAYDVSGNAVWEITQIVGVWGTWQQVRSGVTDVPITYINTFENETYVKPTRNDVCNYCVTNGFCIVTIEAVCLSTSDNFVQILSGLPKPKTTIYSNTIDRQMGSNSEAKATFQLTSDGRLRVACNYGESSISGTRNFYATFSYPVAES